MSPDDPRHGTYAGAVAHWFHSERPCDSCAIAEARYRKRRKLKHLRGEPVTVPALGIRRRVQALMALGYTGPQIAREAGVSLATIRSIDYHGSVSVFFQTADRISKAYERLCMTLPEGRYANRARAMARRRGWAVPLAWDDIDNDPRPNGQRHPKADYDSQELVDEATVLRVLSGENLPTNRAERIEIMRRWLALGRSERSLCVRLGWKDGRYTTSAQEEVA